MSAGDVRDEAEHALLEGQGLLLRAYPLGGRPGTDHDVAVIADLHTHADHLADVIEQCYAEGFDGPIADLRDLAGVLRRSAGRLEQGVLG